VHKYTRVETSKYVPQEDGSAPLAQWKRLKVVHDTLSLEDQAAVEREGFISLEEYEAKVQSGDG
jgi:hypothetical protein